MKTKREINCTRAALFLLILLFGFSISFGQTEESEESPVVVPEQAMKQVVRRILIYSFKPRKKPTTIYLAVKDIKQSWLPAIKNIKFELLSGKKIEQRENIFRFEIFGKSGNIFGICFMSGNPGNGYEGNKWEFRISKQRVRLWQSGLCGSSGDDTALL